MVGIAGKDETSIGIFGDSCEGSSGILASLDGAISSISSSSIEGERAIVDG